ncbi:Cold shock-like protein CspA [Pseudomonas reidholzensis]|uniref:Cold shock-like protein CspA n=1 Tax=Pseudomonas reidholzensis TaxID=1785162 RepID=A0A383RNM2_9PSED|nr:cold shock domain-containing protein [Pseudomonas reidholzensis]SYX88244.1 Cold shock-like protein CspA [Pseudomonas reidholzensis]
MHRRVTGTVKWFYAPNGVGMISADDGSGDYFVSRNAILVLGTVTLLEGQRVTFDPQLEGLTLVAFNVGLALG